MKVQQHMQMLCRRISFKKEKPSDNSFTPYSLCIAALLLNPPKLLGKGLNLDQLDLLSVDEFMESIHPEEAYSSFRSALVHVKLYRSLLALCHDHLTNKKDEEQVLQEIKDKTTEILDAGAEAAPIPHQLSRDQSPTHRNSSEAPAHTPRPTPQEIAVAPVDQLSILQEAISATSEQENAVVNVMKQFPSNPAVQAQACAALLRRMKKYPHKTKNKADEVSGKVLTAAIQSKSIEESNPEGDGNKSIRDQAFAISAAMHTFPTHLRIQRDGVMLLSMYSRYYDDVIVSIGATGGVSCVMEAMVALPDDAEAQIAALGILGNPVFGDDRVVRVTSESRRLVLSAMMRFPNDEQLQGLGCLALINLGSRKDASLNEIVAKGGLDVIVKAMNTFPSNPNIQAAGCHAFAVFSPKTDDIMEAVLTAGAVPACERARKRFPDEPKVQHNAKKALSILLDASTPHPEAAMSLAEKINCASQ